MVERKINWSKILLAALIATFLFSLGNLLGFLIRGAVSENTLSLEQSIKNDISNLETLYILEDEYPCSSEILQLASEKLDYLGELITVLETKKGKSDPQVLELKKLYTLLEVRHFLLMEKRNDRCGKDFDIFLFFYSNTPVCSDDVDQSAFMLTFLRNKYDSIKVYSFDIDLESDLINVLKEQFKITDTCSGIALNGEKVDFKPQNSDELEALL